jgi:hypothetical protein
MAGPDVLATRQTLRTSSHRSSGATSAMPTVYATGHSTKHGAADGFRAPPADGFAKFFTRHATPTVEPTHSAATLSDQFGRKFVAEIILFEKDSIKVTNIALVTDKGKFILSAINSIKLTKTPASSPGCLIFIAAAICIYFWFSALINIPKVFSGNYGVAILFIVLSGINYAIFKTIAAHKTKYMHKIHLSVSSGEVTALESLDGDLVLSVEKAIMQGLAGKE